MASIAERAKHAATAARGEKGRDAETPAQIPAPGWKEIAFRTWKELSKDNVSLVAAGVAFYGLLAMVPLLGATVLTYGLVANPQTVLHNVQSLASSLPKDVAKLLGDQLLNVVKTSGGKKGLGLLVAIAIALWGARNAASSLITALNIAYEEEEKRGFVKVTLLSLEITAAAVLLGMLGGIGVGLDGTAPRAASECRPNRCDRGESADLCRSRRARRGGSCDALPLWSFPAEGEVDVDHAWIAVLRLRMGDPHVRVWLLRVALRQVQRHLWLARRGDRVRYLALPVELHPVVRCRVQFRDRASDGPRHDRRRGEKALGDRGAWSADHVADGPEDEGKEAGREAAEKPLSDRVGEREPEGLQSNAPQHEHPYLVSRATNRAASVVGLSKVGMVSAVLSTLGLSMLRKRGREGAGAALVAGAVGLSLLKRKD